MDCNIILQWQALVKLHLLVIHERSLVLPGGMSDAGPVYQMLL